MKDNREIYFIAALADGEIKDPQHEKKLRDEIRDNPALQFEFFVQSSIKDLVAQRLKITPAPQEVRKHFERKLKHPFGFFGWFRR